MNKKLLSIILLVLSIFLLSACTSNQNSKGGLVIVGESKLELGFDYEYKAKLNGKEISNEDLFWMVSNDNVQLVNNKLTPIKEGKLKLTAILKNDGSKYCVMEIEVITALVNLIELRTSLKELKVGNQLIINYRTDPSDVEQDVIWVSSDENIATVDSGIVTGVSEGEVTITAKCGSAKDSVTLTIFKEITEIEIKSETEIKLNSVNILKFNIDDPVITTTSNRIKIEGEYIYALATGNCTIHVESKSKPNLKKDFTLSIEDGVKGINMTEDERLQINALMEQMSPEQKVGQLFMLNIAINGLKIDEIGVYYSSQNKRYYLEDLLGERSIGNLYISAQNTTVGGYNGNNIETLKNTVLGFQTYILQQTGIGALIIQDGTSNYTYNSLTNHYSDYLSNLELGTINDYNSTDIHASIMSDEISKLGVNMFIYDAYTESTQLKGIFSKNIEKQCINSKIVQNNFEKNGVIFAPYFGTHLTDDYSSSINKGLTEIKAAINSGVEVIDIYNDPYYTSVSGKSIPNTLRQLGFEGMIIDTNTQYTSDRNNYITKYYDAVMSGIDMLYMQLSSNTWSGNNTRVLQAYEYIVQCAENGSLPEKRLNEAVSNVLLQKIRKGAISPTFPSDTFGNNGNNQTLINKLKGDRLTYRIDGNFSGLNKSKTTHIFSNPYVEYFYNSQSDQYNLCATMLLNASKNGYSNVQICNIDSNYQDKIEKINQGDQVVFGMFDNNYLYYATGEVIDDINQYKYVHYAEILEEIAKKTDNIVLVFFNSPDTSEPFASYNYPKIYANYDYDYNFTTLLKVLETGIAYGVSIE